MEILLQDLFRCFFVLLYIFRPIKNFNPLLVRKEPPSILNIVTLLLRKLYCSFLR